MSQPMSRRRAIGTFGMLGLAGVALTPAALRAWCARCLRDDSALSLSEPMRIGVIGSGSLGGTVGRILVGAGHEVMFSSRHPEELVEMARRFGSRASTGTPREAAEFADVILVAVPYEALPQLGRDLRTAWRGKVVLDACNASATADDEASRAARKDGVAATSARLLTGTRLVRAFSCVDATAIASSAERTSDKLGVPIAGNDAAAMRIAERLVRDAGCEPVVAGNLTAAKDFEHGTSAFRANTTAPRVRVMLGLPASI
ncbi:MAG TPA: NADPH-dependent F420 reductase [Gemmatimonas sp.]|uniref:NADPH-dependent F420 reductase n=1 Tax=Gemmatimonas sp. TaxID=1962908 RepID=UPI002ED8ECEF